MPVPAIPKVTGLAEHAMNGLGALGAVSGVKQTIDNVRESRQANKAAKPKLAQLHAGAVGAPMVRVAVELAKHAGLDTEDQPGPVPSVAPKPAVHRATVPAMSAKVAGFASGVKKLVDTTSGPATAVLTLGGAALTVKGVYDAVRAEKDRARMLAQAEADRDAANSRETEFHAARMRLLDSAMRPRIAPQAAPLITPIHDPSTGLSMDPGTGKVSNFNPRLPPPPPRPLIVQPAGPGIMDGIEKVIGPPLEGSAGPRGLDFDHSAPPALRI